MNVQTHTVSVAAARPRPVKKVRRYVVAFQCPECRHTGFLDDFEGEHEVECCEKKFTISLTEGALPDWAQ